MAPSPIPEDIRRFVLTSIPSVPHLEALLLLRSTEGEFWNDARLAARLYISEKTAHQLMAELCRSGMVEAREQDGAFSYRYQPSFDSLRTTIDTLAELYGRQLVDITHLIHSKLDRKAQQFADAFKWRKDS
jgi:Mn-dependent DtxR family transcriptional regulator